MKKVLSVLVVLSMLLSILPATVSAVHWADEDVKYLIENGAIAEEDAMLENLDTPITRSQMVKVIVALLDGEEPIEGKEYFTDISPEDTHIAKAAENGFVNGFGDGTFRPNNPITRQDFFTIVGRAYKLTGEATSEFTDADAIADYAKPYVDALQSIGIVNGYGDGTVNPRGNITIAETLAVMRRTDEHVKANAPKEEEKPTTKPSGGSSGGGGGGGSGGNGYFGPNYGPKSVSVDFDIAYPDDYSSGTVAYIIPTITSNVDLGRIIMMRGTEDTYYLPGGGYAGDHPSTASVVLSHHLDIPEEDGVYAVSSFGPYTMIILDKATGEELKRAEVMVLPQAAKDVTPPTLTVELPEEISYPLDIKVSASDDEELAKLDYVQDKYSFYGIRTSYKDKGYIYKMTIMGRKEVTDGVITAEYSNTLVIRAMDTSGNASYVTIKYKGSTLSVEHESESITELLGNGEGTRPEVTLTSKLEDDFSGDFVATITPEYKIAPDATVDKTYLVAGSGWTSPGGGPIIGWNTELKTQLQKAIASNAVIEATDGVFRVPTFGDYQCYVLDSNGNYGRSEIITIAPLESSDTTPPELEYSIDEKSGFPKTVMVAARDDIDIAKIAYVNACNLQGLLGVTEKLYQAVAINSQKVENGSFTVTEKGLYIICATDTSGNCSYVNVEFDESGNSRTVSDDLVPPTITYSLSTTDECDGVLTITTDISDNTEISDSGWFFMREYKEMPNDAKQVKGAYQLSVNRLENAVFPNSIKDYDPRCGGIGSVCILSNYYDATNSDSGIEIHKFDENGAFTAKENGVYFVYAKDESGNLSVTRIDVDNIKAITISWSMQAGKFTNNSICRFQISPDTNKDAQMVKCFLVRNDYIPTVVPQNASSNYACTENFKTQIIADIIEKSGNYFTMEDGYFYVQTTGDYTFYALDEHGNWTTGFAYVPKGVVDYLK